MDYDIRVVTNRSGLDGTVVDVTSHATRPWKQFSPLYQWKQGIPVPGMKDATAESVESIWQGLKVIDGLTDTKMFNEKPHKRPTQYEKDAGYIVEGHKYNNDLLGIVEARKRIFVPAYRYVLDNFIPTEMMDALISATYDGPLHLIDVTDNTDIKDKSKPYAHAAVLRDFLIEKRTNLDKVVEKEFMDLSVPDGDLWEYADVAKKYHDGLPELKRKALDFLILNQLDSIDRLQRNTAIAISGYAKIHRAEPKLMNLIDNLDYRDLAIDALGMLKCKEAYRLIEPCADTDSSVHAIFSLALIDPMRSVPHIKEAILRQYSVWTKLSSEQIIEKLSILFSELSDYLKEGGEAFINELRSADNKIVSAALKKSSYYSQLNK